MLVSFLSLNRNCYRIIVPDDCETYEQRYNVGCNYASVEDWEAAEAALKTAENAAKTFLQEDEAGEDEIEEETGIIRVQLGYVLQKQGRDKEAQTIYNQVHKYIHTTYV